MSAAEAERFVPGEGDPGTALEHFHRYALAATAVRGRVLDLGCGAGYGSRMLLDGAARVCGLDLAAPVLFRARRADRDPRLAFSAGDARRLPFAAASFEWVVCFELLEHVEEGEALVAEAARVLRPDGALLLSTPNRPVYDEARGTPNPFHLREYDEGELRALLAREFAEVVLLGQQLVAGSLTWTLGQAPAGAITAHPPVETPASEPVAAAAPTYFLAVCARGPGRGKLRGSWEAVMPSRLGPLFDERAAGYEDAIQRLVGQLGEFDARILQLGRQVEAKESQLARWAPGAPKLSELDERARQLEGELAAKAEELARVSAAAEQATAAAEEATAAAEKATAAAEEAARERLREERLRQLRELELDEVRGELRGARADHAAARERGERLAADLAAAHEEAERQRVSLAESERARAELELLRQRLEASLVELEAERARLGVDLHWSYSRWQEREAELATIRRSKMWRSWMAYQAVRRTLLSPLYSLRRGATAATRASAAGLRSAVGWSGLTLATGAAVAAATWRRRRTAAKRRGEAGETVPAPATTRRPRILLVNPYQLHPADHGGGVRILNLIRQLSRHCDIHLLMFSRESDDAAQREALAPLVENIHFHRWMPSLQETQWSREPKSARLFAAPEVIQKIRQIVAEDAIDILQLEYTELGQYGLTDLPRVKVVLTEIDITVRSHARKRRAGMHERYRLGRLFGHSFTDWMRQLDYELRVTRRADQVHVMSEADGEYLARFQPDGWRRLRVVPNAVDLATFRPGDFAARGPRRLLFLGNFEHLPNLDALDYLLERIWPAVRARVAEAELWVVGARADSVMRHHGRHGVEVIGAVPETVPYYQQCRALLAPIRAGSGTRLKILEALACGTPVVTTTVGAEGIEGVDGEHYLIGDDANAFVEATCRVLADEQLCRRLAGAGRELVERRYGWEQSAGAALAGYRELLAGAGAQAPAALPPPAGREAVDVSVIIPTLNGGSVLECCLQAVRGQRTERSVEIVCVDSGSPPADVQAMHRFGAQVIPIDGRDFDHGLTRDLGARHSRGGVLVFLNQDAVPADADWLERLVAPLFAGGRRAAVQGGQLEVPDREQRFFWHSAGERFYFTRESKRWIARYFGIGFSTANAAIRRDVWERHPFGRAPIMEDKKWQREVVAAGFAIAEAPDALVHHTHNYSLRSLLRRCYSEGVGWRAVGERYSVRDLLADLWQPRMALDLWRGLRAGQVRSWAELLFPWLRPLTVFRGNRWGRSVRL